MCSPERTLNCKWARTLRDARTRNGCTADNATMIATAQAFSALDFQIPHFCLRSQLSYSPTIYIFSRAVSAWVCVWMTLWLRRVGKLPTFNIQRRKYVSFERRKKHFSLSFRWICYCCCVSMYHLPRFQNIVGLRLGSTIRTCYIPNYGLRVFGSQHSG